MLGLLSSFLAGAQGAEFIFPGVQQFVKPKSLYLSGAGQRAKREP